MHATIVSFNIKCEFDLMRKMLDQISFSYFNLEKQIMRYYNDELTLFCFETNYSRSEMFEILNNPKNSKIRREIFEIQFYAKPTN